MRLTRPSIQPAGPPISVRFDGRVIEALEGETIVVAKVQEVTTVCRCEAVAAARVRAAIAPGLASLPALNKATQAGMRCGGAGAWRTKYLTETFCLPWSNRPSSLRVTRRPAADPPGRKSVATRWRLAVRCHREERCGTTTPGAGVRSWWLLRRPGNDRGTGTRPLMFLAPAPARAGTGRSRAGMPHGCGPCQPGWKPPADAMASGRTKPPSGAPPGWPKPPAGHHRRMSATRTHGFPIAFHMVHRAFTTHGFLMRVPRLAMHHVCLAVPRGGAGAVPRQRRLPPIAMEHRRSDHRECDGI